MRLRHCRKLYGVKPCGGDTVTWWVQGGWCMSVYVIRDNAWPMLLTPCNTHISITHITWCSTPCVPGASTGRADAISSCRATPQNVGMQECCRRKYGNSGRCRDVHSSGHSSADTERRWYGCGLLAMTKPHIMWCSG